MISLLLLSQTTFRHEPTSSYERLNLVGFTVLVSAAARKGEPELKPALALLKTELEEVVRLVPPSVVPELRKVRFFIENRNPGFPCACYHPDPGWLRENGYNLDKVHSVEISNAKNFVEWTTKWQPLMVLHELAHAYHRAKFGFDDPYIAACFKRIKVSGKYDLVEKTSQPKKVPHYALNNPMEYFAETTEAYFGENDHWPFRRAQLQEVDPQGVEMIERCWGVRPTHLP